MDTNQQKAESWIQVPSRDSSASLSSAADEIVTHGLRVGNSEPQYRRRHTTTTRPSHMSLSNDRPTSIAGSSQDEYTESESESDPVMTSSNEAISAGQSSDEHSRERSDIPTGEGDQDDDHDTALGARNPDTVCFTPQPNAFLHPPASHTSRIDHVSGSYFPLTRPSVARASSRRASFPAQQARRAHSPYNAVSPSYQPDHDAALRASLNTLLACATAARGLPKADTPQANKGSKETKQPVQGSKARPKAGNARIEPSSLRIVSGPPKPTSNSSRPRQPSSSPNRSETSDKGKRKASRSSSKERRASKRLRSVGADEAISPTLLTWVVSASVLVLVSALSFSAGVSVGKEAEKLQASGWVGPETLSDGTKRGSRSGLGLRRRLFHGAVRAVAA